jgi:hypothetical protein
VESDLVRTEEVLYRERGILHRFRAGVAATLVVQHHDLIEATDRDRRWFLLPGLSVDLKRQKQKQKQQ